jgi:hypothetical protein
VELRPAYQYIRYDSVAAGENSSESESLWIVNSFFDLEITSYMDFESEYRLQMFSDSIGKANQHLLTGLSLDLAGQVDLNVMFIIDRQGDPERDADGVRPDKNDYRFTVGLEFEF